MKYEALAEFCDLNMGQSPDSKTYNEQGDGMPFYQGNADFGEIHPETRVWCSKPVKVASEGDILISVRAPIGAMNIAPEACCIGRGLAALTPKPNKCSQKYLYYALESKIDVLVSKGTGSTFKAISKKVLAETMIPSYDDKKQQRITDTLSKIDVLITDRKQQLIEMDLLVKSRFIEMFGDPIVNDKQWIQTALKAVCCKITDGEHGSVPRVEQGYPFLNAKHILRDGTIDWKDVSCISRDVYEKLYKRCKPEKNDILMTTTGTIGNVAIVSTFKPFSMDRGITLLKTNSEQVNSQFIAYLLRFEGMQAIMSANVHASAIGHLFLNKVEQLPVILPPLKLQQQFAAFVAEVDKSKLAVQQGLQKLETLKKSLMQQYFG